jgi:hypothetical protein
MGKWAMKQCHRHALNRDDLNEFHVTWLRAILGPYAPTVPRFGFSLTLRCHGRQRKNVPAIHVGSYGPSLVTGLRHGSDPGGASCVARRCAWRAPLDLSPDPVSVTGISYTALNLSMIGTFYGPFSVPNVSFSELFATSLTPSDFCKYCSSANVMSHHTTCKCVGIHCIVL